MVDPPRGRALSQANPPLAIPAGLTATLVMLRHGESTYIVEDRFQGRADPPLSPHGERQAALAATRLASPETPPVVPVPPGAPLEIVHSPLVRAAATAAMVASAIAAAQGSPPRLRSEPGFTELSQGDWEGRRRQDIEAADGERLDAWRRDPVRVTGPGGERVLDAADRTRTFLDVVLSNLAGASQVRSGGGGGSPVPGYTDATGTGTRWTLLVGHDGILKVALITLLGLPLEQFWTFPFVLCGISVVEIRDGRARLRAHNLADHLASLEASAAERTRTPGAL